MSSLKTIGSTLASPVTKYTHWLHTQWPSGSVEKLPLAEADGSTNVPGLYIVGDLTGIPLLKLSANGGTRVVHKIIEDSSFDDREQDDQTLDLAIIGGGTAGFAAAKEAQRQGLRYRVFESSEPFSTIVNFPKAKPIYTYPTDMALEGDLSFHDKSTVKEGLLEDLREQTVEDGLNWAYGRVDHVERKSGAFELQVPDGVSVPTSRDDEAAEGLEASEGADRSLTVAAQQEGQTTVRARTIIAAIGRSGNYRKMDIPGEDLNKVYNRLHDPKDYGGQNVLVVGGGDSAMETAIGLTLCGAEVTLSYRRVEFGRAKPENIEKVLALAENPETEANVQDASDVRQSASIGDWLRHSEPHGKLTLMMASQVREIRDEEVLVEDAEAQIQTIPNDSVFAMLGREAPLGFFRKSGVRVFGDKGWVWWTTLIGFVLFCFWLYHWKGGKAIPFAGELDDVAPWLSPNPRAWIKGLQNTLGAWASSSTNPIGVLLKSAQSPAFYYTLVYSLVVVIFGIKRIRTRRTPYVKWQTLSLMSFQVLPLFLLPELILPWLNALGAFDSGLGAWIAHQFFPGDSWWRAYGLVLAWPLMAYNWFTKDPIWGWLILGSIQTFVLIPGIIFFWGKGAYCGWICSCGALAETLGDRHRHKMPHGPWWNRLNMLGQGVLVFAVVIMIFRVIGWMGVGWADSAFAYALNEMPILHYSWSVDLFLAGVLGYGLYFWFSGRMWCRFACPLAALMHIYTRFSRFRILAEKKKCISCNVCTSVCHQGIDVMSFAQKGEPMADPECVRCSACVQSCPTGVLSFGQINRGGEVIQQDPAWLAASPVRMAEVHNLTHNGKQIKARRDSQTKPKSQAGV